MSKKRYCYDYPRPMVTVDCVLLRVAERALQVLLVRRGSSPHKGSRALPGGFIRVKEPLEAAVLRELAEETGLKNIPFLVQLGAYGAPRRDPRGRVISVSFIGIPAGPGAAPKGGSDAAEARWYPVEALPNGLAFDHATILGDALRRIGTQQRSGGALFAFLPDIFTAAELKDVLHAVYGLSLDPLEYLKPFLERRTVRQLRGGRAYRFAGRREGRQT